MSAFPYACISVPSLNVTVISFFTPTMTKSTILPHRVSSNSVAKLYLSVKPEYRKNGVWIMNDETALTLRTLKDNGGNYLWNHNSDTIFGKSVHTSEFIPSAVSGNLPVAFGDFSHYWIVNRLSLSVRTLTERFALQHQTGYLAYEFLDGRLTRPEAVKALQIKAE